MKVLHLFDRYLNTTMNWAYNIVTHMENTQSFVAAPILIKNEFLKGHIKLIKTPFQNLIGNSNDEWSISFVQKLYAKLGIKSFQRNIQNAIVKNKIQLVHVHFAGVACLHMNWLDEMNIPFVVSFYGYDYEKLPFVQPKYLKKYQQLFDLADCIICEGEHGKHILISKYSCPEYKIEVVPIGVDHSKIPFHQRQKKSAELKLIQIATFTEKKGHIYTIQSFQEALKEHPNMHLYLVGEEWGQGILSAIKSYIQKYNIEDKVSILDFIPYHQLHQSLESYHVLIQHSIYAENKDCEGGAPVIILDAMATGMPVIGSDHCDIPNIINDKINGWICPSKDINSMATAIGKVYEMDQNDYNIYSQNARTNVITRFDIQDTSNRMEQIYSLLLNM